MVRISSQILCVGMLAAALPAIETAQAQSALRLVKTTSPGFTMPQYAMSTRCEIAAGEVRVTTWIMGAELTERRILTQTRGFRDLIDKAAQGAITRESAPVDIPSYNYEAHRAGSANPVILKFVNGGNGQSGNNSSPEAQALVYLMDSVCLTSLQTNR